MEDEVKIVEGCKVNEHIIEYCKNFIESIDNPQFAVFLKGKWGIGKTYFIDTLLDKYKTSNTNNSSDIDESHIIKISLLMSKIMMILI